MPLSPADDAAAEPGAPLPEASAPRIRPFLPSPPRCAAGGRPRQVRRRWLWDPRDAGPEVGSWERPGWGTLLGPRSLRAVVWGRLVCAGRGLGLPYFAGGPRTKASPVPLQVPAKHYTCGGSNGRPVSSPNALRTSRFCWRGERYHFSEEETESGTPRSASPYKGTGLFLLRGGALRATWKKGATGV